MKSQNRISSLHRFYLPRAHRRQRRPNLPFREKRQAPQDFDAGSGSWIETPRGALAIQKLVDRREDNR